MAKKPNQSLFAIILELAIALAALVILFFVEFSGATEVMKFVVIMLLIGFMSLIFGKRF